MTLDIDALTVVMSNKSTTNLNMIARSMIFQESFDKGEITLEEAFIR